MESLGEKLKNARSEKDLSLDQVSREINISVRFLEALESENFGIFPGEPYIIGFLRNYGVYLDLDVQKLISLYKALRIQEQPIPVEQLLRHPSVFPKFIAALLVILIILGAGGWGVYQFILYRQNNPAVNTPVTRTPAEYMMEGNSMERRFYKYDSILIPINAEMYKLELFNMGDAVTIRTPGGSVMLDLSQEAHVDLNNDGIPELRITVTDFEKNNVDMGVMLHFYLMDAVAVYDSAAADSGQNVPSLNTISSMNTTIIPASVSAYPFTLQVSFQGFCMFRWEILSEPDRRGRNEQYFQRSSEQFNILAQNGIRIWASNAQAVKCQVVGGGRIVPVEIGAVGEVVVVDIRWVRDENNQYRLMLIRLETT